MACPLRKEKAEVRGSAGVRVCVCRRASRACVVRGWCARSRGCAQLTVRVVRRLRYMRPLFEKTGRAAPQYR